MHTLLKITIIQFMCLQLNKGLYYSIFSKILVIIVSWLLLNEIKNRYGILNQYNWIILKKVLWQLQHTRVFFFFLQPKYFKRFQCMNWKTDSIWRLKLFYINLLQYLPLFSCIFKYVNRVMFIFVKKLVFKKIFQTKFDTNILWSLILTYR